LDDLKLTLTEHLTELRSRLLRVVLAVLVLGGLSLGFARELFALLMRPVLAALPEESRSLIYTSGIEELNVLLKVGLYAGLFLATPVALYQLWKFVAPGLLKSERRFVGPFVSLGTLFFVLGAVFCYLVVLPPMFQFLLTPGSSGALRERIEVARAHGDDAARMLVLGDDSRALELARRADDALGRGGEGKVGAPSKLTSSRVELTERLSRFSRLLDAAVSANAGSRRQELVRAIELRHQASALLADGAIREASRKLEEAVTALAGALPTEPEALGAVWSAQRRLAAASVDLGQEEWTRPMLSMREQLSLVLVLEIAFGAIFELPLIMAVLALLGLLRFRWVWSSQRYALVACVALAAIVTPTGDAVNLAMMAVPMAVCFELGVLLVWIFERRRGGDDEPGADSETIEPAA
jgi:sec-independent protein translocase protein TatC